MEDQILKATKRNETQEFRLTRRKYEGKVYFDLRLYFLSKEGMFRPTRKGVIFTPAEAAEIRRGFVEIGNLIETELVVA